MSKRNKPALYELINKSTVKPPDWVYKQKGNSTESSSENKPAPKQEKRPFIPPHVATPQATQPKRVKSEFPPKIVLSWLAFIGKKISPLSLTIIIGGIFISLLIISLFDKSHHSNLQETGTPDKSNNTAHIETPLNTPSHSETDTPLPEELANARAEIPRDNIWPDARFSMTLDNTQLNNTTDSQPLLPKETLNSQCWIICGHKEREPLLYVQKYFYDNGLETVIAKFDNRYILVTKDTFVDYKSTEAKNLKNLLEKIGKYYNNNKPKEAPGYSLATFQSAYAINIERININP